MTSTAKKPSLLHHDITPGIGRTLLLVHPIGASMRFWDAVLPSLTGQMPLLSLDLRGHGQSMVSPGDYSLEQMTDDLVALADEHKLDSFDLCGVSLGGMVALAVAARLPSRVKRVVVCSTAARVAGPPNGWDGRREEALTTGMGPLAGPMVERMFSQAFRFTSDPMIGVLKAAFEQMDPIGYAGACTILRDADLSSELSRVKAGTLVVSGIHDPLCPPEKGKALSEGLPNASHVALDCGHFPPVERPAEFAALVAEHCRH